MVIYRVKYFRWLEPESNFSFSAFNTVRPVNTIFLTCNSIVSSDGTELSERRICRSDHFSRSCNDVITLKNDSNYSWWGNKFSYSLEEWFAVVFSIVLLCKLKWGSQVFESNNFETSLLEPTNYRSYKTSLDSIRLDHDKSAFPCHFN